LDVNGHYSVMFCNNWQTLWLGDEKPKVSPINCSVFLI